MRKIFVVLIMMVFMVSGAFSASAVVDQTLAVINGEPIFVSEFNSIFVSALEQYKQNVPSSKQTEAEINRIKDAILNQKIENVLLKQEVKKQKIKVSKKELQDNMNETKKKFANEAEFKNALKKENITLSEFEKKLSDQIAIMKLIGQFVETKVETPKDDEIKAFYDKIVIKMKGGKTGLSPEEDMMVANLANAIKRISEEQVRLRQIFISCPKGLTSAQLKSVHEKVSLVKKELQKQSFIDVARQYSEDSDSKEKNGDLGILAKGDLLPAINRIVFSMRVGDYTKEPIKTDNGYHFMKVEEKHAKREVGFNDVKNDVAGVLYQNNARKVYNDYINELKTKANIKINKTW
jgi:parvulin-like peptidyl-prolyl isomerase